MPACSQIYLWMETLKYDALNKVVTKNNTTIEALLQPKLEELYCEYPSVHCSTVWLRPP